MPTSSTYPWAAERIREVGVSCSWRMRDQRLMQTQPPPSDSAALPPRMTSSPRFMSAEQGLKVDVGLFRLAELQQRRFAKAEQARQQHIGKLLDAHVVEIDGFVVQLAAIGDAAFQATDALLQVAEALVGAQLRVVLGQREQPPQARAQTGFGLAQGADVALLASAGNGVTCLDDRLQGAPFVLHVLLAGLHQFRQFLMAL